MSENSPPPLPEHQPSPSLPPSQESMKMRWILWVLASVVLPAIPWLTYGGSTNHEGDWIFVLTGIAMLFQFAASVSVAVGFCRKRAIGPGGAVGMSLVFTLASLAIGTPIWFATCITRVSPDFR